MKKWRYDGEDMMVLVCHVIFLRLNDQGVMWLDGKKPLKVSHHPAKSGGDRHCGSGDLFLACNVVLQNRVIKGHVTPWVGGPRGKSPPRQV